MKPFTVFDPRTGDILRSGVCQDHMVSKQAEAGESSIELETDATQMIDLISLQPVPKQIPEAVEESYLMRRLREYPPIGDQLDVLWKEMRNLPLTAEADAMLKRIQAVKERHPKS